VIHDDLVRQFEQTPQPTLSPAFSSDLRRTLRHSASAGVEYGAWRTALRIQGVASTGGMVLLVVSAPILASVLDIHRGSIFGWPGQLLFMVAAALMPLFMVTGFMLYLSRRKHRRMSRPTVGSLVPGE